MPQPFSLTDTPPSMNFIEVNVDRSEIVTTSVAADGDNWKTMKQSDDELIGNRKYLIIVNGRVGGNSNAQLFSFKTTQDHDGSIITPLVTKEPSNYSVPFSYCAAEIITPSVNTKINFEARSHSEVAIAKLYYLRIIALDITDLREGIDYFHSTDATSAEHTGSYALRNTYTIDDDSTGIASEKITVSGQGFGYAVGNWLILGTALVDVDGDGTSEDSYGIRLKTGAGSESRGSTSYVMQPKISTKEEGEDTDERAVLFASFPVNAQLGLSNIGQRFQLLTGDPEGSASPNSYVSSTLIGLNMSRFKDVVYEYDGALVASTTNTELTIKTWSDQPSNDGKAFFIGCGVVDINTGGANFWTGLDQDDVDVFDLGNESATAIAGRSNDASDEFAFVAMGLLDLDSSSTHEYKWQFTKVTTESASYEDIGYAMFSLTYDYENFYDDKIDNVKIGGVRRRKSSPTIPNIG